MSGIGWVYGVRLAISFDSDVAVQRTLRDLQCCTDVVEAYRLVFEELVGKYDPSVTGHSCGMAAAVTLHPGDIVVAGQDTNKNGVVYQVDPISGAHTIISDSTHGAGAQLGNIGAVTMASDGDLWVVQGGQQGPGVPTYPAQIFKIDPATGNRVTAINMGSMTPVMAREVGGQLIVSIASAGLYSLNPSDGTRTKISGGAIGSGPAFASPALFSVSGNNAFLTDYQAGVFRVDLTTGARSLVSSASVGTGPYATTIDVALDIVGNLITTTGLPGVLRIDPATRNRVAISSASVGGGVPLTASNAGVNTSMTLAGLAIGADGSIYTAEFFNFAGGATGVLKIDPVSGNRQFLANMTGEANQLYGITIVPANVPEPSTITLAALGIALLLRRPS